MRTILIAVAVVAVVVLAFFAVTNRDRAATAPVAQTGTEQPVAGQEVAGENVSNRVAGDAASARAFESAQNLEEPVQPNLDETRAIAAETGAVGGTAFTVEGYERATVVEAILASDLSEEEKEQLVLELDAAEPQPLQLEEALAEVRLALGTQ